MALVRTRSSSFLSDCISILRQYPMAAAVGVAASVLAATAIVNGQLARKAQRDNPPKGKFIEIDGVRLHYVERGSGRPLVLFHGNGSMIQDFESSGLIDLASGNYKVIVFDRPGFGHSLRPRNVVWTPGAQADLFARALARLNVSQAIVLGHSWGASVAVALAIKHPSLVEALVLASGYYFPNSPRRRPGAVRASHPGAWRHHRFHRRSDRQPIDVACDVEQDVRAAVSSREVRRLSQGNGGSSVSDPRQRSRDRVDDTQRTGVGKNLRRTCHAGDHHCRRRRSPDRYR